MSGTPTVYISFEAVKGVIVAELPVREGMVTMEATFDGDLQVDSLGMVRILAAIEDEFNIDIPSDDAEGLKSVGDMLRYLRKRGE